MKARFAAPAQRPRVRRSPTRQVLPVIAVLLIASGLVRFGEETGQVLAEVASLADPVADATDPEMTCATVEGPEELVAAFRARETRIAMREAQIAERTEVLAETEARLAFMLTELEEAEASLSAVLALADTAAQDDLARLTAVYENMKPIDAAALFAEMDPAFSAGFMSLMRPDAAAAIMTNLIPETAYSISVILAGRNAGVPTE